MLVAQPQPAVATQWAGTALSQQLSLHRSKLIQLRQRLHVWRGQSALRGHPDQAQGRPAGVPGQDAEDRRRVHPHPDRQPILTISDRERRSAEDASCTAGMRNPASVLLRWPSLRSGMRPVREAVSSFLREVPEARCLAYACGSQPRRKPPSQSLIRQLRYRAAGALGLNSP